jgi:hypothetical protein
MNTPTLTAPTLTAPSVTGPSVSNRVATVHAVFSDAALVNGLAAARSLRVFTIEQVVRHVMRRRATMIVRLDGLGRAVLKVFATPRARGNHRRLVALSASPVAPLVPEPIAADPQGFAAFLSFRPGVPLDEIDVEGRPDALARCGELLRSLHTSGVELDRCWTLQQELNALQQGATEATRPYVKSVCALAHWVGEEPLVSSHRDFHPRQVVVQGNEAFLIDLDDAAMAPAALDLGNFLAHLRRDAWRTGEDPGIATRAVLQTYGSAPESVAMWELFSLARLASLAEVRHRDLSERNALLAMADVAVADIVRNGAR